MMYKCFLTQADCMAGHCPLWSESRQQCKVALALDKVVGVAVLPADINLTHRERSVLYLVAQGYTNKQIAEQLVLATQTIKSYVTNLYRKLDAHTRTEAVLKAHEEGII